MLSFREPPPLELQPLNILIGPNASGNRTSSIVWDSSRRYLEALASTSTIGVEPTSGFGEDWNTTPVRPGSNVSSKPVAKAWSICSSFHPPSGCCFFRRSNWSMTLR